MIRADRNKPLVPAFSVAVNDVVLQKDVAGWILNVVVEDDIGVPGMFAFELASKENKQGVAAWTDDTRFSLGKKVTVSFGYGDELEPVIAGEITALEPTFHLGGAPRLIVRGYDRRHRLNTVRRTRTFVNKKDSEIAAEICGQASVPVIVTDSEVTHDYVLQAGQTDLDFLLERAGRIQYELAMGVDEKMSNNKPGVETLLFRPVANADEAVAEMTFEDDLLDFRPRMSLVPAAQLQVLGWNPRATDAKEQFITADGKPTDAAGAMGGTQSAAQTAIDVFQARGKEQQLLMESDIHVALAAQPEAKQIAKAHFDAMSLDFIQGDGRCRGCTGVRAGKVLKLDRLGSRFSGKYYVTSTVHSYTRRDGYITQFRVQRNES